MKLKKFSKKQKQKRILIGCVIGIILLIGGITLYRTFALYEEKKEFNVLKGRVPDFNQSDIELAMTLNNETINEVPDKRDYLKVNVDCGSTATGLWDYNTWSVNISEMKTTRVKCNIHFEDNRGTIVAYKENTSFWQYRSDITKVVFANSLKEYQNAKYSFEVEEEGSKSVKAYLVPNTSDTSKYTLYINSDGGIIANRNSGELFYKFTNLETIEGLEYFDTSNVVSMGAMFSECEKLATLDLSTFDTRNVTNFSWMFRYAKNLSSLNVSSFNTSKAQYMEGMFKGIAVNSLDLNNFDTSNVTNMRQMFMDMSKLKTLNLSNFNNEKVQYMGSMFENCTSLLELNISSFIFTQLKEGTIDSTDPKHKDYMFAKTLANIKLYVKDKETMDWLLNTKNVNGNAIYYPNVWSEANFVIKE